VNDKPGGTSGRVQWLRANLSSTIGAAIDYLAPHNKENTMLTKLAAALLATALVAGSAIAAQPSAPAGSNMPPAAQTHQSPSTPAAATHKAGKTVKHAARHRSHVRKHLARSKSQPANKFAHQARHAKPAKGSTTHQAGMGKNAKRS
jgi:hypothetical protein